MGAAAELEAALLDDVLADCVELLAGIPELLEVDVPELPGPLVWDVPCAPTDEEEMTMPELAPLPEPRLNTTAASDASSIPEAPPP